MKKPETIMQKLQSGEVFDPKGTLPVKKTLKVSTSKSILVKVNSCLAGDI